MASSDYLRRLQELESNRPGAYQSQYGSAISSLMDKITNRKEFSYDFNADPLYQQYKDQYTKLGAEANMNAVANASSMTGGFGNSYAVTAGSQANQQYLTQLNEVIPELYNAAQNKYRSDTENLYDQYGLYSDAENTAYQKYRDTVNDYNTQLNYYQNAYNNALSQERWEAEFEAKQAAAQMALQPVASTPKASTPKSPSSPKPQDIAQYETAVQQVKERSGSTAQAKAVAVELYNKGTINEDSYKKLLTIAANS